MSRQGGDAMERRHNNVEKVNGRIIKLFDLQQA
jgi:hypothetical protein